MIFSSTTHTIKIVYTVDHFASFFGFLDYKSHKRDFSLTLQGVFITDQHFCIVVCSISVMSSMVAMSY